MPDLSVIIPTLNEAGNLPGLLDDLADQQDIHLQILIADGGSTDGTVEIAESRGLTVVRTDPGRGRQMNRAAGRAEAGYLLFLHADSRLQGRRMLADALKHLRIEDGDQHLTAGHFPIYFIRRGKKHEVTYRYMEGKSRLNRRHCQHGDQGLMLHRDFFERIHGYDESMPFFEDFRISENIHAHGRWVSLPGRLLTSARRFETEGLWPRYLLMGFIVIAEQAGIPEFMQRAPGIYRQQDHAGRLLLTPYFRCFAAIARERGWRGTWQALMNIGLLSRLHWWQTFFYFDVLFQLQERPILKFYDRVVFPLFANKLGDVFSGVLAWVVGMWLFRPYFRLREHFALRKLPRNA